MLQYCTSIWGKIAFGDFWQKPKVFVLPKAYSALLFPKPSLTNQTHILSPMGYDLKSLCSAISSLL